MDAVSYSERLRLYVTAILVLAVAYVAQVVTPLRFHPDSVILLSIAETAAQGGGFLYEGHTTQFPPGYPAIVGLFLKLGIARVWVLIALNVLLFFVGMLAAGYVLSRRFCNNLFSTLNICLLSVLSFVFVKNLTIPLTECLFFGIAMCCLALMESSTDVEPGANLVWRIVGSWILVALCISVRRIGMALIPAVIYITISRIRIREYLQLCSPRVKTAGLITAGIGCLLVAWITARTFTLHDAREIVAHRDIGELSSYLLECHTFELGEIAINVPRFTVDPTLRKTLPAVGALFCAVMLWGVWRKRKLSATDVFFLSYLVVIAFWPYYDPRFWLPVLPLMGAYAAMALRPLMARRFWRLAVGTYLIVFVLRGVFTLISSTLVSYSGQNFPNMYGDTRYRATYCTIYSTCTGEKPTMPVDPVALHILQTYR